MKLLFLVGSGVSLGAGMPTVAAITEQVLSGRNVTRQGGDFQIRDKPSSQQESLLGPPAPAEGGGSSHRYLGREETLRGRGPQHRRASGHLDRAALALGGPDPITRRSDA